MATLVRPAPVPRLDSDPTEETYDPDLLGNLRRALAAYEHDPALASAREQVAECRRTLAAEVLALPRRDPAAPLVSKALRVARQLAAAGVQDYPVSAADRALLAGRPCREWPTLIARMLLGSAWQWGDAPALGEVPRWLWSEYAAWLVSSPAGFTATADAERFAGHALRATEEIVRLVDRNPGSAAVRAVADAYLRHASGIPLYFSRGDLRWHAELRGRIYRRMLAREVVPYDPLPEPRDGRRLRIGILNRHFGPQTETYTTLPMFEQLDRSRFEVILFSLAEAGTTLAEYARDHAAAFRVLPAEFDAQLALLRDARLDVLVFGTNVTAGVHEVTRIALHRCAPLQVVNNSSCITTGFSEVDLYVSGDLTESPGSAAHFSERLGLLPGPAHAFNYAADRQEPVFTWNRAALGIPDDAVVFVSAANYFKIIPEMQEIWAGLLAAVPNSWLLLHPFNPNWSATYPIQRFCAAFDRVLAKHGVGRERLVVSTARFPSRADVRELLQVGDVYLDTFPFGGVNSLVDPLEAGMPVLAWEGATFRSRMGGALLRSLGLAELVAGNEAEYVKQALRLAGDSAWRQGLRERIRQAMDRTPVFLDPLAASDAFGDLLEAAYDELLERGRQEFRRDPNPLRVAGAADAGEMLQTATFSLEIGAATTAAEQARAVLRGSPAHPVARVLLGRALLATGAAQRSADYLMAALPQVESDPAVWFDLARALRESGRPAQALEALETALRLDRTRIDGWLMLVELAEAIGAVEIARQALEVADQLAADDPRVRAAAVRIAGTEPAP